MSGGRGIVTADRQRVVEPAEAFLWRVIPALPWASHSEVEAAHLRFTRSGRWARRPASFGNGLGIDHRALRQRSDERGTVWATVGRIVARGIVESYHRGELPHDRATTAVLWCEWTCNPRDPNA